MRTKSLPGGNLFLSVKAGCARLTKLATAAALADTGVHGAQALALLALEGQGPMKISDLATALDLQKPAATTLAVRLEDEGFVCRKADAADARATCLELTPLGRDKASRVGPMIAGFDATLSEGFSEKERDTIRRFLERIMSLDRL